MILVDLIAATLCRSLRKATTPAFTRQDDKSYPARMIYSEPEVNNAFKKLQFYTQSHEMLCLLHKNFVSFSL